MPTSNLLEPRLQQPQRADYPRVPRESRLFVICAAQPCQSIADEAKEVPSDTDVVV